MRRTLITTEKESMLVRKEHPLAEGVISRDHLLTLPFVVVELTGNGEQASDGFLDERGFGGACGSTSF